LNIFQNQQQPRYLFYLPPPMFVAKTRPNSKSITMHNLGFFLLMLFKYSSMKILTWVTIIFSQGLYLSKGISMNITLEFWNHVKDLGWIWAPTLGKLLYPMSCYEHHHSSNKVEFNYINICPASIQNW
jgi:hypothetical protein